MDVLDVASPVPSAHAGRPADDRGRRRRPRLVALAGAGTLVVALAGCGETSAPTPVEAAQAEVSAAQDALAQAQSDASASAADFCSASAAYITALDRYGDILNQTSPTVGDVKNAGRDLASPREETLRAADDAVGAQATVVQAEQDLADAEAALAAGQASVTGGTPTASETSAAPSAAPSPPPATIARVQQAEDELASAQEGIADQTPLAEAAEQFNAAAVALEFAWLQLFASSGCLTSEQEAQAAAAVSGYTLALQQSLSDAGYYTGAIDGVYGPQTVAAVEALQEANGLPQTGTLDKATAAALDAELTALGAAAAQQATTSTAAVQQTLKLAGYWDGPVDGQWTDALTDALVALQTDLGIPATGTVDAATTAALEAAIAARQPTPSPALPSETATEHPAVARPQTTP
jgi:murein L,D-transpeptidase YcbB/YkuD